MCWEIPIVISFTFRFRCLAYMASEDHSFQCILVGFRQPKKINCCMYSWFHRQNNCHCARQLVNRRLGSQRPAKFSTPSNYNKIHHFDNTDTSFLFSQRTVTHNVNVVYLGVVQTQLRPANTRAGRNPSFLVKKVSIRFCGFYRLF